MFAPFVSPSILVRRDILAFAATEAVRYGITVKARSVQRYSGLRARG